MLNLKPEVRAKLARAEKSVEVYTNVRARLQKLSDEVRKELHLDHPLKELTDTINKLDASIDGLKTLILRIKTVGH